jgi:hypothetical protein
LSNSSNSRLETGMGGAVKEQGVEEEGIAWEEVEVAW